MQLVLRRRAVDIGDDIQAMPGEIDDGRAGDADVRPVVAAAERRRYGGAEIAREEHLSAVRIECVDGVVLGHDVEHVVHGTPDRFARHEERLRVDLVVDSDRSQDAKGRGKRRRGKHRLLTVPAGA
jgi:hypothetical protein